MKIVTRTNNSFECLHAFGSDSVVRYKLVVSTAYYSEGKSSAVIAVSIGTRYSMCQNRAWVI